MEQYGPAGRYIQPKYVVHPETQESKLIISTLTFEDKFLETELIYNKNHHCPSLRHTALSNIREFSKCRGKCFFQNILELQNYQR